MRENDLEDLKDGDLMEDLQKLKIDIERLRSDIAILAWKSTVGHVEKKIVRRPFPSVLWAFGIGVVITALWKIFR